VGVAATFSLLRTMPSEMQRAFSEAALREPYPELQTAALEALADPQRLNRPDVALLHYPELLPEVKARVADRKGLFLDLARQEVRSPQDRRRRSAYAVLGALAEFDAVPALIQGATDPSTLVREAVLEALERLALLYRYHLANARGQADERSREFVERHRAAIVAAVGALLRTYPGHQRRIFLDLALESGGDAYEAVSEAVPARADAPLHRAFVEAFEAAQTEPAVELLFKLALEPGSRLREMALGVMRRRRDPAFARAIGAWLARLSPERVAALAERVTEVPWWPAVEAAADLDPLAATKVMELLSKAPLDPERRDWMILHFLGNPREEVRVRALVVLQAFRSALLPEAAGRALGDPSDAVKLAAARAISILDVPNKARLLGPLLQSSSEELRRLAVRELSREGFARYMESFDRLSPGHRQAAARALAKIDGAMLDRLAEEVSSLDPERRLKALQVVGYVDAEKDLRTLLMDLIADPDHRVRATAVKIVELSGHVEGMRLLIGALSDPDDRVRANAIEAFEEIGDTRFAQLLSPFLSDPDNRVRANAAKALWSLGRSEVKETLESMLADPDEEMRLSAAWAIGETRYEGFADALEARLKEEPSTRVRERIAEALRRSLGV
jgi:HEAT repeat protein